MTVTGVVPTTGGLLITIGTPTPGALVGDTLEVNASVAAAAPLARVEAHLEGLSTELQPYPAGFWGTQTLWKGTIDLSLLHYGQYFVVVTATDVANATTTDSVLFERNPLKGGGSTETDKKNKLVAPAEPPQPKTAPVTPVPPASPAPPAPPARPRGSLRASP